MHLKSGTQLHCNLLKITKSYFFTKSFTHNYVRIGCASGFWGDTPTAAPQLIHHGNLDFLMFDYLSEITMSLLTTAKSKNIDFGYVPDFSVFAVGPYLNDIKRKGIRIISNAGGINPHSCANSLTSAAKKAGVELKVAVVTGDDLMPQKESLISSGVKDMDTGTPLPSSVHSMNAYFGAGPIAKALDMGADIVVTGRCTDSSLCLGPLIHSFKWPLDNYDLLSLGSLAGHLIECGAQVTGGIFTDWETVQGWHNIGFPIAQVSENGEVFITKPSGTGGLISRGTVCEQLLYEIGDPKSYILPDVICDFSNVTVKEVNEGVLITGAKGRAPTSYFKVCATYLDGYKCTAVCVIGGPRSSVKGHRTASAILNRCRAIFKMMNIADFSRVHVQVIGAEESYRTGAGSKLSPNEGTIWLSVAHKDKKALEIMAREIAAAGTGMAPGLCAIVGGRPKPSPILRLHSFLWPKKEIEARIKCEDVEEIMKFNDESVQDLQRTGSITDNNHLTQPVGNYSYLLEELAFARSGDKGDISNIGVIARTPEVYPYLKSKLSCDVVASVFASHFPSGIEPSSCIKRYEVPGIYGLNFVMANVLGGGGIASLRADPQGKAFAQMLLTTQLDGLPSREKMKLS